MISLEKPSTTNDKVVQSLEEQLAFFKQQNSDLTKQIEVLTEQIRQLTKALYGSKSEKSKYSFPWIQNQRSPFSFLNLPQKALGEIESRDKCPLIIFDF